MQPAQFSGLIAKGTIGSPPVRDADVALGFSTDFGAVVKGALVKPSVVQGPSDGFQAKGTDGIQPLMSSDLDTLAKTTETATTPTDTLASLQTLKGAAPQAVTPQLPDVQTHIAEGTKFESTATDEAITGPPDDVPSAPKLAGATEGLNAPDRPSPVGPDSDKTGPESAPTVGIFRQNPTQSAFDAPISGFIPIVILTNGQPAVQIEPTNRPPSRFNPTTQSSQTPLFDGTVFTGPTSDVGADVQPIKGPAAPENAPSSKPPAPDQAATAAPENTSPLRSFDPSTGLKTAIPTDMNTQRSSMEAPLKNAIDAKMKANVGQTTSPELGAPNKATANRKIAAPLPANTGQIHPEPAEITAPDSDGAKVAPTETRGQIQAPFAPRAITQPAPGQQAPTHTDPTPLTVPQSQDTTAAIAPRPGIAMDKLPDGYWVRSLPDLASRIQVPKTAPEALARPTSQPWQQYTAFLSNNSPNTPVPETNLAVPPMSSLPSAPYPGPNSATGFERSSGYTTPAGQPTFTGPIAPLTAVGNPAQASTRWATPAEFPVQVATPVMRLAQISPELKPSTPPPLPSRTDAVPPQSTPVAGALDVAITTQSDKAMAEDGERNIPGLSPEIQRSEPLQDETKITTDPKVPRQISEQLTNAVRHNAGGPVEVALNPEELGRVRMTLQATDGTMNIALTIERPETADLMRRNLAMLCAEFKELGFSDVTFSFTGDRAGQDTSDETANKQSSGAETVPSNEPVLTTVDGQTKTRVAGLDLRL